MARMIPPVVHDDTSRGEKELFRRLRDDSATEDWVILHSLNLARHDSRIQGEVDFVVIIPGQGVLCLEVKGHSWIKVEDGLWHLGRGSKPKSRGPFKQVSDAMHSLRSFVASSSPHLSRIPFWSAVVFPFVEFRHRSTEWQDWQVIDRSDLAAASVSTLLLRVTGSARHLLERTPSAKWFDPEANLPTASQVCALLTLLRPSFELFRPMSSLIEERREELLAFTEEQYRSLDVMEKNPRVLFEGPAGTGKTVLALEAAKRAASRGDSVLLLCFNRLLARSLKKEVESHDRIKASTLHRHLLDVAQVDPREFDVLDSDFWSTELPATALEALVEEVGEEGLWDTLVIDEAQDVLEDPYLDIIDLSLRGGLAAGKYRLFGDFEKQDIFASKERHGWPPVCESVSAKYDLRTNCRNTPRIAAYATLLGGLEPDYRTVLRPDDGVKPKFCYYQEASAQPPLLAEVLDELRTQGFKNDDIIILSPRADQPCATRLSPPWRDRVDDYDCAAPGKVRFTSIHAFKGLEAPAIVLSDLDVIDKKSSNDLFYVGVTRALHRLVILASSRVRDQMRDILLA